MGTLTRTIVGTQSSSGGYVQNNGAKEYNYNLSAGSPIQASVSSARLYLKNFKSYAGGWLDVYINNIKVAETVDWFSSNSNLHDWESELEGISDALLTDSISSLKIVARSNGSGNLAFLYVHGDNAGAGGTVVQIDVKTTYSDPSAPSTVKLNNTSGNIDVVDGTAVTLSWSGASGHSLNPIVGYQVYRGDDAYGQQVDANTSSMSVERPSAGNSYTYSVVAIGSLTNSGRSTARKVYCYTNVTAPTSVTVNKSVADADTNVILSWSGAVNGTGNNIQKYQVYRSTSPSSGYTAYGQQTAGGTASVPAPSTMGATYYYKVAAIGQYNTTSPSEVYASVTAETYSAVSAPTAVECSPAITSPDNLATLSWSGAAGGTNTSVASYEVYRSTSANGTYTLLDTASGTSLSVQAPSSTGSAYYYKIKAIANKTGFDSDLSSVYGTLAVPAEPNAPVIQGATSGKTYNARPRILCTIPAAVIEGVKMSIVSEGWTSSRSNLDAGQKVVLRKNSSYSEDGQKAVMVSTKDELQSMKTISVVINYEDKDWTDDPVVAGTTAIKAAHMNELRTAIDNLRLYYGMTAYSWQEQIIAGVTSSVNWAVHANEIKEQIEAIRDFVNEWDSTNAALDITLPTISSFYAPRAEVINQLREAIEML